MMYDTNIAYNVAEPETFVEIISQVPAALAVYLTIYSAADYLAKGATCYLSSDRRSGYAITEDKDLISVFSLPGAKQGQAAVKSAIDNGAETLDCLGTYLAAFYRSLGFVEYDRMTWDNQYAPEGWDYDANQRPDVIFMRLGK